VYGAENVPRTGPAVIACNHIAGIDVVVLGAASPRTLRYMAKAELFTYNRALTWLVRHAGAFAVRRGESDLEALRLARRVLRAGHPLGVFCEGTRQPSEAIGRVQPGAALIALADGAPIVPVVIQGTIYIKKSLRHPVTVMFGPPLAVAQTAQRGKTYREAVVTTTAELQRELERLQRRTQAALTLSTGAVVHGCFFLAGSRPSHAGPERVADLLNAENGFFPFEFMSDNGLRTALINRAQVVEIRLLESEDEARADPGYAVATEREVCMLLSIGRQVTGRVRVQLPTGRDRLSDYTRAPEAFRYVETSEGTLIVNSAHIVELREANHDPRN